MCEGGVCEGGVCASVRVGCVVEEGGRVRQQPTSLT